MFFLHILWTDVYAVCTVFWAGYQEDPEAQKNSRISCAVMTLTKIERG